MHVISTGILSLDRILGGGFYPGSITEIRGDNFCGKSSLVLHALMYARDNWDGEFTGIYISTTDELPSHLGRNSLDGLICLGMEDKLVADYIRGMYFERPQCLIVDSPSTLNNSDLRSLLAICSSAANLGTAVILVSDNSVCHRQSLFSGYAAVQLDMMHTGSREKGGFKTSAMCRKNKHSVPGLLTEILFPLEDNLTHESNAAGERTRSTH